MRHSFSAKPTRILRLVTQILDALGHSVLRSGDHTRHVIPLLRSVTAYCLDCKHPVPYERRAAIVNPDGPRFATLAEPRLRRSQVPAPRKFPLASRDATSITGYFDARR